MCVAVLHIKLILETLHRDTTTRHNSGRSEKTEKKQREIDRQRARVKTFVESILYAESIQTRYIWKKETGPYLKIEQGMQVLALSHFHKDKDKDKD